MSQAFRAPLEAAVTPYAEAPLFPNRAHRAMSTRAVRRMLENHCRRADLEQAVSPHDLRHSFGSRLIGQGAPAHTVQVLMGHVRLASTQRYVGVKVGCHLGGLFRKGYSRM